MIAILSKILLVASLGPFQFLLGSLIALPDQTGATGGFTFKEDVQGRVIVRTNYSDAPATAGRPASRHDDLMVIYSDGDAIKADYFDNEGHVIRYVATATNDAVVFVSESTTGNPRYRLTYRRGTAPGTLDGSFEIAPPSNPGAFAPYLSWRAQRSQ